MFQLKAKDTKDTKQNIVWLEHKAYVLSTELESFYINCSDF